MAVQKKDSKKPAKKACKKVAKEPSKKSAKKLTKEKVKPQTSKKAPKRDSEGEVWTLKHGYNADAFTMDDVDLFLKKKSTTEEKVKTTSTKKVAKKLKKAAPVKVAPSKSELSVASIADILGFNPAKVKTREAFEEKDVPQKWKSFYRQLVDLKKHYSEGIGVIAENDTVSEKETGGQDAADIGTESFERDMTFNILSNEQEVISQIDEAIERIHNGTYGICEITGKEIPTQRLEAVPYARCTIEGQAIMEKSQKRSNSNNRGVFSDFDDDSIFDDSE